MSKYDNKFRKLTSLFERQKEEEKRRIRAEPKRSKRFLLWLKYLILFPFRWLWLNLRDWRTLIIFIIVVLVIGSEVWVPLLLGLILQNAVLLGVASTCWAFWLMPFTPFMPLCIAVTIGIKALINRRGKKHGRRKQRSSDDNHRG